MYWTEWAVLQLQSGTTVLLDATGWKLVYGNKVWVKKLNLLYSLSDEFISDQLGSLAITDLVGGLAAYVAKQTGATITHTKTRKTRPTKTERVV